MCQHQNLTSGPAICDTEGSQWTTVMANEILHELLYHLFNQAPSMFPSHIGSHRDILLKYHIYHLFRQALDSRAISKEGTMADIRFINHWQKAEKAQGLQPSYDLPQHYTQIDLLLLDCCLLYTMDM
jgi:hypothetical protein